MERKILNYRIHIDQEKIGKKIAYNASCPTLGLADFGSTLDEAIVNIKKLIQFHIETLEQLDRPIPFERDFTSVITSINIPLPSKAHLLAQ
ncbi:MAG: type II toxin-antitoxin system HicB family antitoxin [Patescibacteria group bacterium]